jgi:3-phosphoshikimate 1-carboxyvinyltransferase
MGVTIDGPEDGEILIHGVGLNGLQAPSGPLDLGNSGTSMRLLAGLLSGQSFDTVLLGDHSLTSRPMRRVTEPLGKMGASIETSAKGTPPLHIKGGQTLRGIDYRMPIASAQVKSSLLLGGLYAQGNTCISEPTRTRDHTERMLVGLGYRLDHSHDRLCLAGGGVLEATTIDVPADISSAAFFMVGASISPGSDLLLEHVGVNPTRTGVIDILRLMGGDIELANSKTVGSEPVADIRVRGASLSGIDIPSELVPLAIDEFPVIFVAAACANGITTLTDARELRVKESDRIQAMSNGLNICGIKTEPRADGIVVHGGRLMGGLVDSHHDHRVAMAFAMAGLRSSGSIEVRDCANVETSFPSFVVSARSVGLNITG